jgi:DNA topoisomerase-2
MLGDGKYLQNERKHYFIYTLNSRAIPYIADGLKPVHRRLLWEAKDGKKQKTAALAGSVMYLHPHAMPDDVAAIMGSKIFNNHPLLEGQGAFGTILDPYSYGATRYTSIKISDFSKDVMLRDIDLVPMVDNYDNTCTEPAHFLPLIPIVLVNGASGVAGGFATNILPRKLSQIINDQISILKNVDLLDDNFVPSYIRSLDQLSYPDLELATKHYYNGRYEIINAKSIRITSLPHGVKSASYINMLEKIKEKEAIKDYIDYSKDTVNIVIKLNKDDVVSDVVPKLKLVSSEVENITLIDFSGKHVIYDLTYAKVVEQFTNWRLQWYIVRYTKALDSVNADIERLNDLILSIENNIGNMLTGCKSKAVLVEWLTGIGVINTDYIAGLPIYRFSHDEVDKTRGLIADKTNTKTLYEGYINTESKRKALYIKELQEILKKYAN